MILTSKETAAVAAGRKRTHRTAAACRWRPGHRLTIREPPRKTGRSVSATNTEANRVYVEITDVEHVPLAALTRDEATAEGFGGARGPLAFKRRWLERHDKAWVAKREATDDGLTDEQVAGRFVDHHEGDPIVVLSWRLAEEPDLYLAQPTRGSGDYTRNPHRAIDPLPVMGPTPERIRLANEDGERRRASFRRDLEAERAARRAQSARTAQRVERGRGWRDAA